MYYSNLIFYKYFLLFLMALLCATVCLTVKSIKYYVLPSSRGRVITVKYLIDFMWLFHCNGFSHSIGMCFRLWAVRLELATPVCPLGAQLTCISINCTIVCGNLTTGTFLIRDCSYSRVLVLTWWHQFIDFKYICGYLVSVPHSDGDRLLLFRFSWYRISQVNSSWAVQQFGHTIMSSQVYPTWIMERAIGVENGFHH